MMILRSDKNIDAAQVEALYKDAQWSLYTRDMSALMRGIKNSLDVLTLWDKDQLIALVRTVGDGESILYIQDILVLEAYQRQGHGSRLLHHVLDQYPQVRMKVLMTDNTDKTKHFYESIGFKATEDTEAVCFWRNDTK